MTPWRFTLFAAVLVAVAGLGAWAWFGTPREQKTGSHLPEERLVPINRERTPTEFVHLDLDRLPPASPDAYTRRRFDGRWDGVSDVGRVSVLMLDGVGDLILGVGTARRVGRIEIYEFHGDDLFELRIQARRCVR